MKAEVQALKTYLTSLDIESFITPSTEISVVDQLEVPIGVDDKNRERRIIVMIDNQIPEEDAVENEEDAVRMLKFLGIMPIEVKPEHISDVARMVSFLNHVADIPGFLVSEPLSSVYFLYSLPCPGGKVEPVQFVSILGLVGSQIDEFQPFLEQIANGELSVAKVLSGEVEL